MSKLRTANLLGAMAGQIAHRIGQHGLQHPNETSSTLAALNVIGMSDGCSNGALAQALGLSHTAAVRLVDKLEAGGFVSSTAGADKRFTTLRLTAAGRKRALASIRDRCVALGGFVDVLSAEQQAQLASISETVLRAMVDAAPDSWFICRLCDTAACPPDECPVHTKALALEHAESGVP